MAANVPRETVLGEYWRRARPLVVDMLLWLTVIAGLLIVFAALKLMETAGYIKARIEFLENIHFIGSAGILVLFMFDLFMKTLSLMGDGER